jgi:hypothetical protein
LKRSTLAVASVLVLLVAYVYYFEWEPVAEEHGERLFEVDESAIDHIEIRARDEETIVVDKAGESWALSEPLSVAADEDEVSLLIQTLTTAELERSVGSSTEVTLEDFGLDEPVLEVRFQTTDGAERGLQFGKDTPTGLTQYARRSGDDEILVVSSHLSNNFTKTAWGLRDKRLFHYAEDVVPSRVEIERPEGRLLLENTLGLWFISGEARARADRYAVEGLISRFRHAEMTDIVSDTSAGLDTFGLDPYRYALRVEWIDEALAPLELRVGSQSTVDFYAKLPGRPELFLVDGALVKDLRQDPGALRSTKLFDYVTSEVGRVRVQRTRDPEAGFDIENDGDETSWAPVKDLLFEMGGVSAEEIVEHPSLDDLALSRPSVVVSVWWGTPEREETIRVGEAVGESVFVQRDGDDVALRVSTDAWDDVEKLIRLGDSGASQ